jgi:hypothetical protein
MPQDVELGGLREHPNDPVAVYEITLRRTPPAGLTARFPSMTSQPLEPRRSGRSVRQSGVDQAPMAASATCTACKIVPAGSTVWIWRKLSSR